MSRRAGPEARPAAALAAAHGSDTALRRAAEACTRQATRQGRLQVLALRVEIPPFDLLAAFAAAPGTERFFFERPSDDFAVAAMGALRAIETRGPDRFRDAGRLAREALASLHVAGCETTAAAGPLLVGGFAFGAGAARGRGKDGAADGAPPGWRGFPPGRLVLPEVLLVRSGARSACTVLRAVMPGADSTRECDGLRARLDQELRRIGVLHGPLRPSIRRAVDEGQALRTPAARAAAASGGLGGSPPGAERQSAAGDPSPRGTPLRDVRAGSELAPEYRIAAEPSHEAYRARVAAALRAIGEGDLEKVVTARSIRVTRAAPFPPHPLLTALRRAHPTCATFAIGRPGSVFLGATPERLARVSGRRVSTAAVAGSAPRGRSPGEDAQLARSLVESKKEQAEHAVTVRALRAALADLCPDLEVPEAPRLLRLEGIQHLETPVAGTLRAGCTLLDVASRLHPTPAVGGAPRDAALAWLARSGEPERGWYAGPVGFLDAEGGGELCVGLRSALLCGGEARLFAGAGVVAGSDPDSELRETRLKLRAMLDPLLEI